MATRTASVTGNWDDTATWGGSAVPTSVDDANINGDIVVTIPVGVTAAASVVRVGFTANSTGTSTIINNGTLNITTSTGRLFVGQGTGKDGKYTFGPSSVTDFPTGTNLFMQNGYLTSTATRANPAKVTGVGGISTSGVTGPRQDIQISNVSFQMTGATSFVLQDTTGAVTSQLNISNCVWAATGNVTFGATDTLATCNMSVTDCDFRDMGGTRVLIFRRAAGGGGTYRMLRCTSQMAANTLNISPTTSDGLEIGNCVLLQTVVNVAATSGGMNIHDNFMSHATAANSVIILSDAATACTMSRNYFPSTGNNFHPIKSSGSGGTGTHIIEDNIMDGITDGTWTDKPDLFIPGATPLAVNMRRNLVLQSGELWVGVTAGPPNYAAGITARNNTIAGTVAPATATSGHLFDPENTANAGTINIQSNLHLGNGAAAEESIGGASSGGAQTVTYSDYNNFFNVTLPYSTTLLTISTGNTSKTVPGGNDTAVNPKFFAQSRNLGKWNLKFGSGTDSYTDGITYMLGLNGYRGTPNFDQNGTAAAYTVANLASWVSYGYSPTALSLRGTGDPADGSPDKGAMSVRCPAGTFF